MSAPFLISVRQTSKYTVIVSFQGCTGSTYPHAYYLWWNLNHEICRIVTQGKQHKRERRTSQNQITHKKSEEPVPESDNKKKSEESVSESDNKKK